MISGYFNSSIGVGEASGPIASGMLVATYGFRSSNDLIGSIILTFTVLFFIFNGNFSLCLPPRISSPEDADDHFAKYKDFESAGPASSTLETDVGTQAHSEAQEA